MTLRLCLAMCSFHKQLKYMKLQEFYTIITDRIEKDLREKNKRRAQPMVLQLYEEVPNQPFQFIPIREILVTGPDGFKVFDTSGLKQKLDKQGIVLYKSDAYKPAQTQNFDVTCRHQAGKCYLVVYDKALFFRTYCYVPPTDAVGYCDDEVMYHINDCHSKRNPHDGVLEYKAQAEQTGFLSLHGGNPSKVLKDIEEIILKR